MASTSGAPSGLRRVAPASAAIGLTCSPESAAVARSFVTRTLRDWGFGPTVVDDAVLLTSELVGNAVRHCVGTTRVRLVHKDNRVRVEVHDDESRAPVLRSELSTESENGRGLQLVDVLALSWGWQPVGPGKQVWFELPRA